MEVLVSPRSGWNHCLGQSRQDAVYAVVVGLPSSPKEANSSKGVHEGRFHKPSWPGFLSAAVTPSGSRPGEEVLNGAFLIIDRS